MNSKNKVLVIGLDGATLHLVKDWATEGKLPNLAKLMAEGSYGHSQTVPNQNSAPAWSSLMTGKNPGKQGIYLPGRHCSRAFGRCAGLCSRTGHHLVCC